MALDITEHLERQFPAQPLWTAEDTPDCKRAHKERTSGLCVLCGVAPVRDGRLNCEGCQAN
jgi:hypothetical protein